MNLLFIVITIRTKVEILFMNSSRSKLPEKNNFEARNKLLRDQIKPRKLANFGMFSPKCMLDTLPQPCNAFDEFKTKFNIYIAYKQLQLTSFTN